MKRRILNFITKHLFNGIIETDFLFYNKSNHKLYIKDKELSDRYTQSLYARAYKLKDDALLNLLTNEIKYIAQKKIYYGNSQDDIMFGKAMLYNLDLLQNKINAMASMVDDKDKVVDILED